MVSVILSDASLLSAKSVLTFRLAKSERAAID